MERFSLFPTAIGDCGIAWRGQVVVATLLPAKTPSTTANQLISRTGAVEGMPPPDVQRAIALITRLLEGGRTDLSGIVCDLGDIEQFALDVYAITREIQVGETMTYGEIASRLGDKQLARSVGQTLGRNPLPIIVPCHRVLGANGKLTGFSAPGGVQTKLKMLMIEGTRIGQNPGLFDNIPLTVKPKD